MSMNIKFYTALFAIFSGISFCMGQDILPSTSLVYPGVDGKLVYVADSLGNKIPDFSNAGYKGGGVMIPYVPNKVTVWPVAGDNSASIQTAIDRVSALPLDPTGFRGAVLLKMGTYSLDKPLYIKASGVILRGEGMGEIGTILFGRTIKPRPTGAAGRAALINISGDKGITVQETSKQIITNDIVPVGSRSFNVVSAKSFKIGDKVLVRRNGNQDWIKAIGEDSLTVGRNRWRPFVITYDRIITNITGNNITIDAPVFTAIETRWGGGDIVKYNDGRIENVAVENLRGISEYDPTVRTTKYGNMDRPDNTPAAEYNGEEYYSDENHYNNMITIHNAENVWVRNISGLHFMYSVVQTNAGSKWITIQDCESWEPVSVRAGGRRFIYHLQGQLTLVQRCFSQKGRHSFVLQNSEASGNVFLDCKAVNPYSTSEPHNKWANGVLYDNVKAPLTARFWHNFSIGWAGANIVMWNCEGDFLIQSPPTANNYSFGHIGTASVIYNAVLQDLTKPRGYIESLDKHVTPNSLYLTQLKDRLGLDAVNNTIYKANQ